MGMQTESRLRKILKLLAPVIILTHKLILTHQATSLERFLSVKRVKLVLIKSSTLNFTNPGNGRSWLKPLYDITACTGTNSPFSLRLGLPSGLYRNVLSPQIIYPLPHTNTRLVFIDNVWRGKQITIQFPPTICHCHNLTRVLSECNVMSVRLSVYYTVRHCQDLQL